MGRDPTAWRPREKEAFRRTIRQISDAELRLRYQVILHWAKWQSVRGTAAALHCSVSTVVKCRRRYREAGLAGLDDRRADNGQDRVTPDYELTLLRAVDGSPQDYGHRRPTWTQELLAQILAKETGIRVSVSTVCRVLHRHGARRGMPKPIVGCPWPARSRKRRLSLIRRLIETLPKNEAAVYEDELDVHLNPKIGPDWMLPGKQKRVMTPGKNEKEYVAGAMDAKTDEVIWTTAKKKNSDVFVQLLEKLNDRYADRRRIHVILDNYVIHRSRRTRSALVQFGGWIVFHFLPPYCPDDNRIERCVWRELHANVTRNHNCETMAELMDEVDHHLKARNVQKASLRRRAA